MDQAKKDFKDLHAISLHARTLVGIKSLLEWDQETYMPSGSAPIRAAQVKALAGIIHKERTDKKFAQALAKLIDIDTGDIVHASLSPQQQAALKEWRRKYLLDRALPQSFIEDFAQLTSESVFAWEEAKKEDSFETFLPYLEKVVDMSRKKADYLGFEDHPYDALLDQFEPYMTTNDITSLFDALRKSSTTLLEKIQSCRQINDDYLHGGYSKSRQLAFNKHLLELVGFPLNHGRLDLSSHPFSSSSHPTDNRITTRISHPDLMGNLRTVLHECGHAFYEMGLPQEHYGSPLGESISLGIHESQSRWWETRIGMSKPFWKFCLPIIKKHFKGKLDRVSLDSFWRAINKVEPSMIRVEADEVTYGLHVILRFELEVSLIGGELAPKDIPEAWNEKMQQFLGIKPKNNKKGCLQDIHWSMGGFGYFPTYTLGNLYAAQFFNAFERKCPDWETRLANGELQFIKDWLAEQIHRHGKRYTSKELIKKVTGKHLSIKPFEEYLLKKYTNVYQIG